MTWSLYSKEEFLKPLVFSNGKTQEDVVKEVLDSIEQGHKIIFIHGICGTGKSAIALNIARKLGKTSIIVPGKNLQSQYQNDYLEKKYLLKENGNKLKIDVITGRNNHKCKFLEDNQIEIPKIKKEVDSRLYDIFEGVKKKKNEKDISADNYSLPCKIEIQEKNWNKIKEYLKKNKDIDIKNFTEIKDVKRVSIAGVCPYWCPVIPDKYELGGESFVNSIKKKYKGLDNTDFIFYERKQGCKFYEQFNSFIESDVIVFNSLKYKLESALGRKPLTEVEIIDECDDFLDSFSNQREINIDRLQNSLIYFLGDSENAKIVQELQEILKQIKRDEKIRNVINKKEILSLKETGIYDLIRIFVKEKDFIYDFDDESYVFDVEETAKMYGDFINETYLTLNKKEDNVIVNLVTTNLAKKFNEMVKKNKVVVLMSGTLHSENVLKNIFGLKEHKLIEAEVESQGRISVKRTGMERDCKYSNFSNGKIDRKYYLKSLSKCVEIAKKPVLVHVNAFLDLPSEEELKEFDLNNLISKEKLREMQKEDKTGILVKRFKSGQTNIFFSTRSGRGIDFPGEECNSIIFTKYPNPNVQDAFWKILHKTKPMHYWDFYKDKARRELWQKVYRGLRFKEDSVNVLSPDLRVLEVFEKM
ncbi:MAG: helicase C-terminal domain-containing protein [archaeon]